MQALTWSLPLVLGRSLIVVLMAVIHLLAGLAPLLPVKNLSAWEWPILSTLLVSAVLTAWVGLGLTRQGNWEGPSQLSLARSRRHPARAQGARRKFRSALGAQFWLEWRRQGWTQPGAVGVTAVLVLGIVFIARKRFAEAGEGDKLRKIVASLLLILFTWKNLIGGISAGLTGRRWVVLLFVHQTYGLASRWPGS